MDRNRGNRFLKDRGISNQRNRRFQNKQNQKKNQKNISLSQLRGMDVDPSDLKIHVNIADDNNRIRREASTITKWEPQKKKRRNISLNHDDSFFKSRPTPIFQDMVRAVTLEATNFNNNRNVLNKNNNLDNPRRTVYFNDNGSHIDRASGPQMQESTSINQRFQELSNLNRITSQQPRNNNIKNHNNNNNNNNNNKSGVRTVFFN
eukprot:TRINITY_DN10532_c1_g1_i1.p1 TRINITY_DN10532_c1_g1~~TRINITY_DN10532_c1_g1_i1.p1  ORF type:complete len:205 (-),score=20.64 TRINITY_DN10532_c1_g1_i1:12-626(-)